MRTPLLGSAATAQDPSDPERVLDEIAALHPSGRLVDPAEVASLVAYLLSDAAASIVGTCLVIDRGRHAKLGTA